ncbi:MAG: OmpH family outer membrane protein, partial [Muribaculum sp.]|nr:OmpH family outer membrane protein [Muribaculum sp.]
SKTYEAEFQKLQEQMNKEYADFQNLDPSTPEAIKQRRQQELQDLYTKLEQFRATATQDLQRQHQQLMAPIVQKVQDAITKVGQEQNLTFVFENGVALYTGADVLNITADVKKALGL